MNEAQHLRGTLGLGQAVALGVSGTLGGGIFVLVGSAVGHAGPAALLAFAPAFAGALCIALPYAELVGRYPHAVGAYAATRATLGPWWGSSTAGRTLAHECSPLGSSRRVSAAISTP